MTVSRLPAGRRVGAYVITSEIARGGMAVVYRAYQPALDREVALKELAAFSGDDLSLAERFLRESRVAGSLNNGHIVHVHDYFQDDGVPYIAMELLERGSLRPYIGTLSVAQSAWALQGILAGLGHAHERGIVHRDLKPENVLVTRDGAVKIADFGIAKAYSEMSCHLTMAGMTLGTPVYMAPEQAQGLEVSPRTDLYAVGVVAYELLLHRPPFRAGGDPRHVMQQHLSEPAPPPQTIDPELDDELAEWLLRLLAKPAEARPASADEAWDELERIVVRLGGSYWRRTARLGEARAPDVAPGYVTFPRGGERAGPPPTPGPAPPPTPTPAPTPLPPAPEPTPAPADAPWPGAPSQPEQIRTPEPHRLPVDVVTPEPASTAPPRTPLPAQRPPDERPRRGRRVRRAVLTCAVLVAVSAVAAATGLRPATDPPPRPILSAAEVEAQVRDRLEPVNSVESVTCPQVPRQAGHTFECVAVLSGGQRLLVRVEQLDGAGTVHLQPHV